MMNLLYIVASIALGAMRLGVLLTILEVLCAFVLKP